MTFKDLHYGELPLLLPNAWDVPSALALLECGFTAIGTTSFGVASSLGRPDGGRSTDEANLGLAAALRPLDCYVSMDIEDGYAKSTGAHDQIGGPEGALDERVEDSRPGEFDRQRRAAHPEQPLQRQTGAGRRERVEPVGGIHQGHGRVSRGGRQCPDEHGRSTG